MKLSLFDSKGAFMIKMSESRETGEPSMKPTRSFSSLFRHCRWIATALLALACSWSAMGQGVTITSVRRDIYHTTPPANGTAYNTGEEVYIVLVLSDNIVSVEGTPRLRLTNLRAGQTEKYSYATYYDFFENGLIFKYVVEAGDFTDDLDVDQFERVGTTIMVEGGRKVDYSTAASLMNATPLSDSADIAFRTIGFRGVPDPRP